MPQAQPKFVILDRDGVINLDSDQFIKTPDEWVPIEGSLEAIAMLNQAGYRVAIASNQSGIGRGLFEMSALNAMHEKMYKALANLGGRVEAVFSPAHRRRQLRLPQAQVGPVRADRRTLWHRAAHGAGGRRFAARPRRRRGGRLHSAIWCAPARARRRWPRADCPPARACMTIWPPSHDG